MKFDEAKEMLLDEGYRIIGEDFEDDSVYEEVPETNMEDGDVFTFVEQGLGDEGFDAQEVADIMSTNGERIEDLFAKGVEVEDIIKILAYENCEECDDEEEPVVDDVPVDEATLQEGKSKPKSDKFAHKQKVAGKKKKCYDCDDCDDCDDEDDLDESFENVQDYPIECLDIFKLLTGRGYDDIGAKSWIKTNKNKIEMFLNKGYSAEDIVYELDGDLAGDMDESLEDVPGLTRGPRGQQGTDDWSDFKDDFRKKTLFLKKALTPQFVSGIIKDTDFEVDEKDIKEYAFKNIEEVFETKDPVANLQRRIRKFFVG